MIPTVRQLLQSADDDILADACWAVSYLTDGENFKIRAVVDAGMVPRLVELLAHPSDTVKTPALRSIGNIVTGEAAETQSVIDANGLQALFALMGSSREGLRKEVCW
jgi:importin subunit alpha-1